MLCPKCHSGSCRSSQRRGIKDHFWSLFALRPWRCRTCGIRFFAWTVPAQYFIYVHCARCGNLDLQRVARERVSEELFTGLKRALHFPAYRCDPCRRRFFSLRPFRRIPALRFEPSPTETHDS
ncbi:MAG: hypothetical protein HY234_13680 [Acidobacteria bacterium]|nr:hypothetical protein [Acidobacteriota bacterium]